MRVKLIHCQVFTREIEHVVARSAHMVDVEPIAMGLHSLGVEMRPHLQERIDAADAVGHDAILLGYAFAAAAPRACAPAARSSFFPAPTTASAC